MAFNPECNSFTSALTNTSASFQQPIMSLSTLEQDTITTQQVHPGQIILYQSPSAQIPSITYAQLPAAHYLLLRSQTNPNEFQIVSAFPTSIPAMCPNLSAPYPFISTAPMYPLSTSNQVLPQTLPISYQIPTMHYPQTYVPNRYPNALVINSIPDFQQNNQLHSHPMQLGAGHVMHNNLDEMEDENDQFFEVQRGSAFHNTLLYSDFRPRSNQNDLMRFMTLLSHQLKFKILNLLNRFGGFKDMVINRSRIHQAE